VVSNLSHANLEALIEATSLAALACEEINLTQFAFATGESLFRKPPKSEGLNGLNIYIYYLLE